MPPHQVKLSDGFSNRTSENDPKASTASPGDTGGQHLNDITHRLVFGLALFWSIFQLYIAFHPINSMIARSIHLTFAIVMVYLAFPAGKEPGTPKWLESKLYWPVAAPLCGPPMSRSSSPMLTRATEISNFAIQHLAVSLS